MKADFSRQSFRKPVRITIPAKVAYDLEAFQKSIASLVEELGCRACFSGADCTFQLERNYLINENLNINSFAAPSGIPDVSPAHDVSVTMSAKVGYDLGKIKKVVASIADRLGCGACCSGFDILFKNQLEFFANERAELL